VMIDSLSDSDSSESYGSEQRYMHELMRQQIREMEEEKVPDIEVDYDVPPQAIVISGVNNPNDIVLPHVS